MENPKPYIDRLKTELNKLNPFSTTTNTEFTDPKETPGTKSTRSRVNSLIGVAGAGAVMMLTLVGASYLRHKNGDKIDDNQFDKAFDKSISGDTTVAGETFISETNDSTTYDGSSLMRSSSGLEINEFPKIESSMRRSMDECTQSNSEISHGIYTFMGRPRTVAEIENLLLSADDDVI